MRVFLDGCFDLIHYGHANALYKASCFGHDLVVGVHSDEEIAKVKGHPVFTLEERVKIIKSFRWVFEVVPSSPYVIQISDLDNFNCDFCAHADDITRDSNNEDCYRFIKLSGRYLEYKRTVGVSTTDIIEKILKQGHDQNGTPPYSTLYPSVRVMANFVGPKKPRNPSSTVVYVDGAFDIYHVGFVSFLEKAKEEGNYLIVGLYSDKMVKDLKGNYPICSLYQRMMVLLANKHVDDVIMDVPFVVDDDFLDYIEIDVVVHGRSPSVMKGDPYECPRRRGILRSIDSCSQITTEMIIERVKTNIDHYEDRNNRKLGVDQQKVVGNNTKL